MRVYGCVLLGVALLLGGCAFDEEDCEVTRCRQFYDGGNYCSQYCP